MAYSDIPRASYEAYRFCYDNGHQQWVAKAKTCFDFWNGEQWDAADVYANRKAGRPSMTFNIVESLTRTMAGVQRAMRNDVRFIPVSGATMDDARIRDMLWLHVQQQNQFDFTESDLWLKGLIMGRSFVDVRAEYDESLQGHVILRQLRSQDVVLDPTIESYDPEGWPQVFVRRFVSYNDLVNMFGKAKAEEIGLRSTPSWYDYEDSFMSQQMGALPYYMYAGMEDPKLLRAYLLIDRQYREVKRKEMFVDIETGDMSEIPETWDRNRIARVLETTPGLSTMHRKVNTVRWTVTCEDTVLHDDDSPYKWFTTVPFFPSFIDGVSKGVVESMIDPQRMFNKITSQEVHLINSMAGSGYKVKTGSLTNMTLEELEMTGARPGLVVELRDINDLEKIQPNNIPQGHDRISGKADGIIRSLGGVSNQARGFAREDVAGEAILANQAATELNLAGWLANLHRTKQLIASRVLDVARAHYTETRMIMVNRGSPLVPDVQSLTLNEPTPEGTMLNDITSGRYTTTLIPAPSRTTLDEADFKMLMEMRKLGIAVPDAMLIELSPAANKAHMISMLQGDSNERDQAAQEAEIAAAQELNAAKAEKERTAASLNAARAAKFAVESQVDPDASYERVERERMAREDQRHQDKMELEREKIGIARRKQEDDVALRLTDIEAQAAERRQQSEEKQKADKPKGTKK